MKDERLSILLDGYLDGALSADEKTELERMLLESDAARRQFWRRASLHGWSYSATKLAYGAQKEKERKKAQRPAFSVRDVLSWFLNWKPLAGLAAACVAAVAAWFVFSGQPNDFDELVEDSGEAVPKRNTVATLAHGAGVVWVGGANSDMEIGAHLEPGKLQLKAGVAQLRLYNGVEVILEGPADFDLVSADETRLQYGKLTARVPENARGFKVRMEDLTVTDLGTEFGVNRLPSQSPSVHVFKGEVALGRPGSAQPAQLVIQGQGFELENGEMRSVPANRTLFISEDELTLRESAELQSRLGAWKYASTALNSDPAMLVHYDFESRRTTENRLANRSREVRKGTEGAIMGCNWTEGRWPGKGALDFDGRGDRVRFTVPGKHRSLTYMAWIRVDTLTNSLHSIALTERRKPGEPHLQITRNGRLAFSVRQPVGKDQKFNWDSLTSKPVLTPDWIGRWMHVAAVYDGPGKTMSIYANGRLVGTKNIAKPLSLELGAVELGNWARKQNSAMNIRPFEGRMDEFTLLARPLAAEEIRRQYELGKPRETITVAAGPQSARP